MNIANIRRRSTTPWPIRALLVLSIVFGMWVDVSSSLAPTAAPTSLVELFDGHPTVATIIRSLASRHG